MKLTKKLFISLLMAFPVAAFAADTSDKHDAGSKKIHEIMQKSSAEMPSMKMSGDTDKDFAKVMAEHHKSGIEMAEAQIKYGQDPELKAMAKNMVEAQIKEKKELEKHIK